MELVVGKLVEQKPNLEGKFSNYFSLVFFCGHHSSKAEK